MEALMGNGYFWGLLLFSCFLLLVGFCWGCWYMTRRMATALHDNLTPSEWRSVEHALERASEGPDPLR